MLFYYYYYYYYYYYFGENRRNQIYLSFLIKTSESPSTTTSCNPSSMAKIIPLRQARASTSSTEGGRGIFSNKAPMTKPSESLMTTPIPALEQS